MDFRPGSNARVRWPPTDNEDREGYAGMYWPVTIVSVKGDKATVTYDNGEKEEESTEHLHPADPPVEFGNEAVHYQVSAYV